MNRYVAIKVCNAVSMKDYFLKTNGALESITSENVVDVKGVQCDRVRSCYVIMELIEGGDLQQLICKQGRLSETEARHIFRQLLDGLDACHSRGIYHLDVKPENVLIDGPVAKLADFGTSLAVDAYNSYATYDRLQCQRRSRSSSTSSHSSSQGEQGGTLPTKTSSGHSGTLRRIGSSATDLDSHWTVADWMEMEFMENSGVAYTAPECHHPNMDEDTSRALFNMVDRLLQSNVAPSSSQSASQTQERVPMLGRVLDAIDIWGLGVTLFVMCAGYTPWESSERQSGLVDEGEPLNIPFPVWFSQELRDLLSKVLVRIPSKRPSLADLVNDGWTKGNLTEGQLDLTDVGVVDVSMSGDGCVDHMDIKVSDVGSTSAPSAPFMYRKRTRDIDVAS